MYVLTCLGAYHVYTVCIYMAYVLGCFFRVLLDCSYILRYLLAYISRSDVTNHDVRYLQ